MEKIINGQDIAKNLKLKIKNDVQNLGFEPCLAVIIVGNDPASEAYVKNKEKACKECGIRSLQYKMDENITEDILVELIERLNNDNSVQGILVQLPLPKRINKNKIINIIAPNKDVDCFHPVNIGKMFANEESDLILPCTPKGCMILLKSVCPNLSGKKAAVVGRSNIVGKPMAQLLLNENCTVTILHSKTMDIENELRQADIVVLAIGREKFLRKEMLKEGAIVIDVGINRMQDGKLCGDADFDDVYDKCSFITPVPKGVGPMTVACLLLNLLTICKKYV
jgi:methylenetetrahydrofolate dehydrogenase (NADP+)/methenyltetrahydrofolate cyclohydrolase